MRALCWYGTGDVRVERVPDPTLVNPRDAVVRVSSTAIMMKSSPVMTNVPTVSARNDARYCICERNCAPPSRKSMIPNA